MSSVSSISVTSLDKHKVFWSRGVEEVNEEVKFAESLGVVVKTVSPGVVRLCG